MSETKNRKAAAQHRAQIRILKRGIAISAPIIAAFVVLTVCAYVYDWHPVAVAALTVISFMQLIRLPGYFTRLAEQRGKLQEVETRVAQNE